MDQKALALFTALIIVAIASAICVGSYYILSPKGGEKGRKAGEEERGVQIKYPSNLAESAEWRAAVLEYYRGFWGAELPEDVERHVKHYTEKYFPEGVPEDFLEAMGEGFKKFMENQALGLFPVYGKIKLGMDLTESLGYAVPMIGWLFSGGAEAYVERAESTQYLADYSEKLRNMMIKEAKLWRKYRKRNISWNKIKGHLIREKEFLNWVKSNAPSYGFECKQNNDKAKAYRSYVKACKLVIQEIIELEGKKTKKEERMIEWTKTYGGEDSDGSGSVVQTSDGGFAIAGETWSYAGSFDFWLVKLSGEGRALLVPIIGGVVAAIAMGVGITVYVRRR